jgi:hypothetical protein
MKKKMFAGVILTAVIVFLSIIATLFVFLSPFKEFAVEVISVFLTMFTLFTMIVVIVFYVVFGKKGVLIYE